MSNALVSVILPNYNHGKYLDDRIQNILNQSYDHLELIILDDNSTDNSVEIINRYKTNSRVVKIIVNEVNSGSTFIQWRKGVSIARGDYIWIAESDDLNDVTFLETGINFFLENENCTLFFSKSRIINEKGEYDSFMGYSTLPNSKIDKEFDRSFSLKGIEFVKRHLMDSNLIPNASGVLFKKRSTMNFDELTQFKLLGDWYFWIKTLAAEGEVYYSCEELNYFRNHGTSVRELNDRTFSTFLEYQKLYLLQQSIDHSIKRKLNDKLLFKYLNLISKEKGIFTKKSAFLIRHPNFFMSYLKSKILCLLRECQ